MSSRGPAPKPTVLKKLAGNPGKRSLSTNEPRPRAKRPRMPSHFTPADDPDATVKESRVQKEFYEIARGEWRRVVRELSAVAGLVTSVDADALAMYCETYARWVQASRKLAMSGMVEKLKTNQGGEYLAMSPYVTIINQCMRTMKQLLTEFGMTPASRTRIQIIERPPEEDPFDEFLSRR